MKYLLLLFCVQTFATQIDTKGIKDGAVTNAKVANSTLDLTTKVTGTLPVANGGTGQTSTSTAINALLPTQTGNSGNYLTTNGTSASWAAVSSSGANTTLSNLTNPTSINRSLVPETDSDFDLGTTAKRWQTGYIRFIRDTSGITAINVNNRALYDASDVLAYDFANRDLYDNGNNVSLRHRLTTKIEAFRPFMFVSLASDPASPENGWVYYNTTTNKLRVRANGAWVDLH